MKKNIIAGIVALVFIASAASVAPASALTVDELQTQIKELLAKVASLQLQLRTTLTAQTPPADPTTVSVSPPSKHRICSILARNLSQGTRGDDVRGLQEFLSAEGYLSANATGYFGPMTMQAVAKWQASEGVSPAGSVGPMSRERIRYWCGGGKGTLNASPTSGKAPLAVNFTYSPVSDDNGRYYIEFGDGQGQPMDTQQIYCIRAPCISPSISSHTYTTVGTYTANVSRYIPCLYTNPRCMMAQPAPLASVRIQVGGSTSGGVPTISSFSGPTTLAINASGTWTIQASDPEGQSLSYNVTWGDEYRNIQPYASAATRDSFVQTTTFTHAYAQAGTYTVIVIVSDASGAQAKTSSTVRVGSEPVACTMDAMQCPNGSWVGRTGPNCQFVCP